MSTATPESYWRHRCQVAEQAMQAARRGIKLTPGRRDVLRVLGELKPGESISTDDLARAIGRSMMATWEIVRQMRQIGLIETHGPNRRGPGQHAQWRLGYMVVVNEQEAEAC